jgi:hypothetical protein
MFARCVQLGYNNVTHLGLIKANTNESLLIAADLALYNSTLLKKIDSGTRFALWHILPECRNMLLKRLCQITVCFLCMNECSRYRLPANTHTWHSSDLHLLFLYYPE